MTPKPSIGRIVHYEMSEADVRAVESRYRHLQYAGQLSMPRTGDVYPAVIVRTWPGRPGQPDSLVSLQVLLDGATTYWATSRQERTDEETAGRWFWPPRV